MADFAAAQARINSRRAASLATLNDAHATPDNTSTIFQRLPPPLRAVTADTIRFWDTVKSRFGTSPAFRVGQVDSELLDEELLDLLSKQAGDGLKLLGSHLKDDWAAEISLILRLALWKLSIWDHCASYGANLQGLKYVDARSKDPNSPRDASKGQKAAYGMITVVGRYAWSRWTDWLTSHDGGYDIPSAQIQRLNRVTNMLTTTHEIASFASFLVFLYNGRYRTLTDRILQMRLVPATNQTNREVSFEYLNRQLVWHAFTEFLLFLLPLVGISRWRRWVGKAWKKVVQYFTRLRQGRRASMAIVEESEHKGELAYLPERTCPICYQDQNPATGKSEQDIINAGSNAGIIGSAATDITNPYETIPCGCVYDYICLTQRIEAEEGEGFTCLRCGEPAVKSCKPWHGDVLEDNHFRPSALRSPERSESVPRPPSRKSVAFADDLEESGVTIQSFDHSDDDSYSTRSGVLSPVEPMPVGDAEDHVDWTRSDEEDSADED